jgi:hypothetical protein
METDEAILAARAKLFAKMGNKASMGGKGTQRRKVKAKHQPAVADDKKPLKLALLPIFAKSFALAASIASSVSIFIYIFIS